MKTLSALISAATLVLTIPGSWGFQNDSLAQTHSTAFRDANVPADQKDSRGLLSRRKETAGPRPVRSTARSSPVGNRHQRSPSRPVAVKGPFLWPTGGKAEVVRRFDPPAQRWLSGHRGVDLDAQEGSTIFAAGAGTVAFAGKVAEKNVVSIDHGSLRTTYEPVTPRQRGRHRQSGRPHRHTRARSLCPCFLPSLGCTDRERSLHRSALPSPSGYPASQMINWILK